MIKRDFSLDSFTNKVIDPVGAGDALLAYSTLVNVRVKVISSGFDNWVNGSF